MRMMKKAKFMDSGVSSKDELDMSYEWGGTSGLRKLFVLSAKKGNDIQVCYQVYGYEWTMDDT